MAISNLPLGKRKATALRFGNTLLLCYVAFAIAALPQESVGQDVSRRAAEEPLTAGQAGQVVIRSIPRLPDGSPDLQGFWNISTLTPFERRGDSAGRETLTEQEAAILERQSADRIARASAPSDPNRQAPPAGGAFGGNVFWVETGRNVATINGERRTSLIVDPPDGRIPYTPRARAEQERVVANRGLGPYDSYLAFDTGDRCITDGVPWIPFGYNDNFQIVQTHGHVTILHEMFWELRVIPLDDRPQLGPSLGSWKGDSRAHWEGDTLVVRTSNFADKSHYLWNDLWRVARPTLRVVERFRLIGQDRIDYEFTVEDPTTFTRPWTAIVPMTRTTERMYEYACHEGNYGIGNSLRAARAADADGAVGSGAR